MLVGFNLIRNTTVTPTVEAKPFIIDGSAGEKANENIST